MDRELIGRAQVGDQAAFRRMVELIAPRFHAIAFRILRDLALSEDATQDALLAVWQDLPQVRDPDRFEAWSYRVLVRICYAHARRARRLLREIVPTEIRASSTDDELETVADRDQLERGFQQLSVEKRTVVVLHHYLGLPVRDVAAAVDAPVETVRSRLARAMRELRAAIDADDRAAPANHSMPRQVTP